MVGCPGNVRHSEMVAVPISDLPPSETALIWLTVNHSPNIHAFARTATDVLAHSDVAAPPTGRRSGCGKP